LVNAMPTVMMVISTVGTAAMLWVGGSIIVHGLKDLGWPVAYDQIHHLAEIGAAFVAPIAGFANWFITAFADGVIGLALGLLLIPIVSKVLLPAAQGAGLVKAKADTAH
ncbi:MAG: DUF808 family protein, partial [Devosiaceae bacterium]|nr:DUF808 family protein [Devosiaceae bacterium MH13]